MTTIRQQAGAIITADGWYLARTRGSHRQYWHKVKPGTVTVAGKLSSDLPYRIDAQHSETGRAEVTMEFAVVIERGPTSYGAYVPDLPGCVAVGDTQDEVTALIREAIKFHIEGMRPKGEPVPVPTSRVEYVTVAEPASV